MSLIRLNYQDMDKLLSEILLKQSNKARVKKIEEEVIKEVFK